MSRRAGQEYCGLHHAAMVGDDDGVRRALRSGANVNDLDLMGRTAIMCAVAGEHWDTLDASTVPLPTPGHLQVLRTLLSDAQMALFTLNAPQMAYRGVTPLGMAAWLNESDTVRVLLEDSVESSVAVDGRDVHGATPLMYAARDGGLDVVRLLLRHGACPDASDGNYRTAVQYALAYPQILWLCEMALRRHRWLESQATDRRRILSSPDAEHPLQIARDALSPSCNFEAPPLSFFSGKSIPTNTIIESVKNADIALLHSFLFAPSVPPSSHPQMYPLSSPVLVNLPDAKGWSAIHYCAAAEYPSVQILDALYCAGAVPMLFTVEEHWTPLHCFVQSPRGLGRPELLYQFLAHLVNDLRAPLAATDREDETCIHIAAEKGTCIEVLILLLDCDTSGTVREMRNARGLTALEVCKPEFRAAFGEQLEELRSASSLSCYTIRPAASDSQSSLFSSLIYDDAAFDHEDAASLLNNVDISASSEQLLANLRLTSTPESSAATPFHLSVLDNLLREAADITAIVSAHYRTVANEAEKDVLRLRSGADKLQAARDRACRDVEQAMRARGITPVAALLRKRFNRESEDSQATVVSVYSPKAPEGAKSSERIDKLHSEDKTVPITSPAKDSKQSGTTKLKAWMLRKLTPSGENAIEPDPSAKAPLKTQQRLKLDVIPEQHAGSQKPLPPPPPSASSAGDLDLSADAWTDSLIRTSYAALQAASRDLDRIRDYIILAEHFISVVDRCAARTERVVSKALRKRQLALDRLRAATSDDASGDEFFVRPGVLSAKSSLASLSSVYSARSSCVSLAATLVEQEDDETRLVRRLLLRKIDAGASGIQEQLERGVNWLCAVKEVVRGAKRTAYI